MLFEVILMLLLVLYGCVEPNGHLTLQLNFDVCVPLFVMFLSVPHNHRDV
jgi:hypothetical protein